MPNPCKWRHAGPSGPPVGAANATPNFGKSRKSAKLVMIFDLKNINFFIKISTSQKFSEIWSQCAFKCIYLRAQEELVGQTVIVAY